MSVLGLPIDIQWERLCASEDMIDRLVCDRLFPFRWRSSLAVFSYEPPEEDQVYRDMLVSYLKVSCTITGFQSDPVEVGLKHRRLDSYWNDPEPIANFKEAVSKYYGCYGALLEVAVAPAGKRDELAAIPASRWPYFADIDPKRRELFEVATETGEVMSRSLEDVNVTKGTTTSQTHEALDILNSASANVWVLGGSGSGQWGTRDVSGSEFSNVRSADQSKEKRETFSHSTQYTQMYQQFTAYHLGTNRAVFYVLPRPRIVQSDITFVNGPRMLEGIQEVFLVVMRRKGTPMPCVEAYLETAHIASIPNMAQRPAPPGELHLVVAGTSPSSTEEDQFFIFTENAETFVPQEGLEVDLDTNGGYKVASESGNQDAGPYEYKIDAFVDHVDAWGRVQSNVIDGEVTLGSLDVKVQVFQREKDLTPISYDEVLWITGRGVCCCPPLRRVRRRRRDQMRESILIEIPLPRRRRSPTGGEPMSVAEANRRTAEVGQELLRAHQHAERYPYGEMDFADAQFLADTVARSLRAGEPDDQPLAGIDGLDASVRKKISAVSRQLTRRQLLGMSMEEQTDRFGLVGEESHQLRRALLGLEGPDREPAERWKPLSRDRQVPDVVGLPLEQARARLTTAGFAAAHLEYGDSELPRGTVLKQRPSSSEMAASPGFVDLTLASGAILRIPDLIGKHLSEALEMLRRAGLESEPSIQFKRRARQPSNIVLTIEPSTRSYVTPHTQVVLHVSSGTGR
jgi:hypothetical protein